MAVTINASTSAGLVQTADTTGNLSLQSNGTTIAALTSAGLAVTGAGTFSTTLGVTGVATLGNGAILGTPASGTVTNLTGTASININGTVGATTPTTGAFTSGTFSTTLGVTGLITGSANGKFLLANGATTGALYADIQNTGGRLIIGVANSAGTSPITSSTAYSVILNSDNGTPIELAVSSVTQLKVISTGVTIPGTLGVTGAATLSSTLAVGAVTATSAATHTFNSSVASFAMNLNNTSGSSPNGLSVYYSSGVNGTGNPFLFCSDGASVERATIRSNGGLANFSANNVNLSDANVKSRIEPIGTQWDAWKKIEWMKFKYDDQTHDDWNYGYTAQNIESIYPELVDAWQPNDENSTLKAVYSEDLKNITGSVLQEAQLRIEQLEARLAALESK